SLVPGHPRARGAFGWLGHALHHAVSGQGGGARAARAPHAMSRKVGHRCPLFSDIAARGRRGRAPRMLGGAPSGGAGGPPWGEGGPPVFVAVRSGFESWGRSHLCATGATGAPVPRGERHHVGRRWPWRLQWTA